MAQSPSGVRRVPMLLTALSAVVLLIATLGAVGVLESPLVAAAATPLSAPTPADGPALDDASGAGAGANGEVGSTAGSTVVEGRTAVQLLATNALEVVDALTQPAADAATPEPVDSALVPVAPAAAADPTALPADSGTGRRVVYSIHGQRVWVVEADGTLTHTYPVSGRLDRPGPGTYEVYSKSPTAISYDYSETMQYMIRFAQGENAAIGFHDIPVLGDGTPAQTVEQLGQPLSAGCVRQAEADAEFLWGWADVGTQVVVVA